MGWIRLDVAAFSDRALRRAGPAGKRAFIAALMLSKERDWRKDDEPGWLPDREFDGAEVALHWSDPETPEIVSEYDRGIRALLAQGILKAADGGYWISGWRAYQPDSTALARKRKERRERWEASKNASRDVTGCHGASRDVTVTQPQNGPVSRDVTVTHRDIRDVTLRYDDEHDDVTRRDVDGDGTATSTSTSRSSDRHPPPASSAPRALPPGVAIQGGYKGLGPPPVVTGESARILAEAKAALAKKTQQLEVGTKEGGSDGA